MADGFLSTQGTGTTIATDDIAGVHYQRVKLSQGTDGSAADVSSAAPLQVTLANHSANATAVKVDGSAVTQPVSGSVATTNAGTFVVQENGASLTALQLIDDTIATLGTTTYTEATTKGSVIGAVRRDANTTLVDITNEIAPLQVNATGELKVAQIQALPAGTNNIGDVDVLTVNGVAPAFGTGVRGATVQRVTIATDDSVPVTIASVPSHAVTNAGTFVTQENGALLTSNQLLDDVVTAQATAIGTTKTSLVGVSTTTAAPTYTTGTINPLNSTTTGALRVDNSGVTQPVSGTVSITTNSAVNVAQINAVAPLMGNGVTGTGSQRVTIASDGTAISTVGYISVKVDQTTPGTTNAVSLAQIGGTTVVNGGLAGSQSVGGTVANNVAPTGNPLPLAGIAVSAEPTANTATRISQLLTDLVGKLIVLPYANPENFVSGAITTAMTATTTTSLVAAPGAGLRNYITTIIVSNAHATVGTDVAIQDGSAGTTLLTIPAAAVYGGAVINLPVPLRQPTANTALFCANVTTGASTKASAVGYKGV